MKKACIVSKKLTLNESNVVYMGYSNPKELECSDGLCAVYGSLACPAKHLREAQEIVQKRFPIDTPVVISIAPGIYECGNMLSSTKLLPNIVGIRSPLGNVELRTDLIVENHLKLEMENIVLKGNLEVRAHGEHQGDFLWNKGDLIGSYVFDLKGSAKQSLVLQDVNQNVIPDSIDQVYDNIVNFTDNASGLLQKIKNKIYSPLKSKLTLSKQAALEQIIEDCLIMQNGEENYHNDSSKIDGRYLNNIIKKPTEFKNDGNFYTNSIRDDTSIKRTWNGNTFTVDIGKDFSFLQDEYFDKSRGELNLLNNTYTITNIGKILTRKMYNNSSLIKNSSNNTIDALEESEVSMLEELHDEARSYSILDKLNINTPLRQEARNLYDSVQFVETLLNSRINSFGYKYRSSQNSSSICTSNGNFYSCREKGFHGESINSHNSKLILHQNNNTRNLINQVDKNLFDFEANGNATVTTNVQGNQSNYRIIKNNVQNCRVYNMICRDRSKYTYHKNSGSTSVVGGGLYALSLNDESQHESSISNVQCTANELETALESVNMTGKSQANFNSSNMTKHATGGIIHMMEQSDDSQSEYTSIGNHVKHISQDPAYITNLSGKAKQKLICSNSIRKVENMLKRTETRDDSMYEILHTNSQYTSGNKLHHNIAYDRSIQRDRGNGLLLEGKEYFENVDTKYSNTEHKGDRKCINGQHELSDCEIIGSLDMLNGSLTTNFSKFRNDVENIISENTEQSHNVTSFQTEKSNNIVSKAKDGKLVKILLKTCNMNNTDQEVAHLKAIHDINDKSLTEVKTGVLHTVSKFLIDSDLKERVKLLYSESFKNSIEKEIKVRVGELIKNSNGVKNTDY
jgi:hypothetical protein